MPRDHSPGRRPPLLCLGDDFAQTDLLLVSLDAQETGL
jgi:uncharacterized protein with PIN domain